MSRWAKDILETFWIMDSRPPHVPGYGPELPNKQSEDNLIP